MGEINELLIWINELLNELQNSILDSLHMFCFLLKQCSESPHAPILSEEFGA